MALGTKENSMYNFHLIAISIDTAKKTQMESALGRDWMKVPKNKTDTKTKIVERILEMRKMVNENYVLD